MRVEEIREGSGLFDASIDVRFGLDVAHECDDALEQFLLVRFVLVLQRADLYLCLLARFFGHLRAIAQLLVEQKVKRPVDGLRGELTCCSRPL